MQPVTFSYFSSTLIQNNNNNKMQTNYNSTDNIAMNSECQEIFSRPSHDKMMQKCITIFGKAP